MTGQSDSLPRDAASRPRRALVDPAARPPARPPTPTGLLQTPVPPLPAPTPGARRSAAPGPAAEPLARRGLVPRSEEAVVPTGPSAAVTIGRAAVTEDDLPTARMQAVDAGPPVARRRAASPPKPARSTGPWAARLACGLVDAGLVLALPSLVLSALWVMPWLHYLNSGSAGLSRLIPFAAPGWALALTLMVAGLAVDRSRRGWPVLATALSAAALTVHLVAWLPAVLITPQPIGPHHLRVASINVDSGRVNAQGLVAEVRRQNLDVAVVQELTVGTMDALRQAGWDDLFPHNSGTPRAGVSSTVFSRMPQVAIAQVADLPSFQAIRLSAEGTEWIVIAGHPVSPDTDVAGWRSQSQQLADLARAQDPAVPSVLVGDLNSISQQAPMQGYRAAGFSDSRREAGAGWQPTWPAGSWIPPYAALDHVLTGPKAVANSVRTFPLASGVHRGLVVEVSSASR